MGDPLTIFILAGDTSGERQGAALATALAAREPGVRLQGIGGERMRQAGVEMVMDSSAWSAIGVGDSLRRVPHLLRRSRQIVQSLRAAPPDLVVLIDFGTFNVRFASMLAGSGIPILYYFPPRSWSRRRWGGALNKVTDLIATPFAWNVETMSGGKAEVVWVGHPLVDQVQPRLSPSRAADKYGLDLAKPIVALIPGSRVSEVRGMFPAMAAAAGRLAAEFPGLQLLVPVAPGIDRLRLERRLAGAGLRAVLLDGTDYDALQLATVAAATSGTVTLELALLGVPAVVLYRVSCLSMVQFHLARALYGPIPFIAMPNIIVNEQVYPEFLQSHVNGEQISQEVGRLLRSPEERERIRHGLGAVRAGLGPGGATEKTAELALKLARRPTARQA